MQTERLFASSAEQNKSAILTVLMDLVKKGDQVLELGSGTGQHACYFANELPSISWQPTELRGMIPVIRQWLETDGSDNIQPPLELDVNEADWPVTQADAVYTANTLHIVSEPSVESLFRGVGKLLAPAGFFVAYGPFSFAGKHTSESNANFDMHLRSANAQSGVRDMSWLDSLAVQQGLAKAVLIEMPVNNFMAVWRKPTIDTSAVPN